VYNAIRKKLTERKKFMQNKILSAD